MNNDRTDRRVVTGQGKGSAASRLAKLVERVESLTGEEWKGKVPLEKEIAALIPQARLEVLQILDERYSSIHRQLNEIVNPLGANRDAVTAFCQTVPGIGNLTAAIADCHTSEVVTVAAAKELLSYPDRFLNN